MAFNLQITFSGLCLFVPHDRFWPLKDRLHVLLIEHETPGHRHFHCPRLVYDKAHEASPPPPSLSGNLACVQLDNCLLNLEDLAGSIELALPCHLIDLPRLMKAGKLDRKYVEKKKHKGVIARVELTAGAMSALSAGALWTVPNGSPPDWPRLIAPCFEWTIRVDSNALTAWRLESLIGATPPTLRTLTPIDDTIRIWIYNVKSDDLPPPVPANELKPNDEAEDFAAYYELFKTRGPTPIVDVPRPPEDCSPKPMRGSDCNTRTPTRPGPGKAPHTQACIMASAEFD